MFKEENNFLVINNDNHSFTSVEKLKQMIAPAIENQPVLSYCRHIGFKFIRPIALEILKEFLGNNFIINNRYVDDSYQWGRYYSPRHFKFQNKQINIHPYQSSFLSQVKIPFALFRAKFEACEYGNLINQLDLNNPFNFIEKNSGDSLADIAAAWDYAITGNGNGYVVDKLSPNQSKVDHHVSCFKGSSVIYIPLHKMFTNKSTFDAGLNYLKNKFITAKKAGTIATTDAHYIIIEANPQFYY